MCWSKRCCFFVELDIGCLFIGILTLTLSISICISSIVMLGAAEDSRSLSPYMHQLTEHLLGSLHLDVNQKSKELVLSIILFIAVLKMVTSSFLIVGVRKHFPGFVLLYFGFGIFVTFFISLSSLLLLLKNSWGISITLAGASLINVHFLVVVHTFYELLLRGKVESGSLDQSNFDDDTDFLVVEVTE